VTLWQAGRFRASSGELRAAIRASLTIAEAYYTLGTVLKQKGELQDAVTALREAIRLQPGFAGAHITLATVLRQLGDTEEAAQRKAKRVPSLPAENQRASRPVLHQLRAPVAPGRRRRRSYFRNSRRDQLRP